MKVTIYSNCCYGRCYATQVTFVLDCYIVDTLMRDLVAHSHAPSAFLVYLQIYRLTHGAGKESVIVSHASLAEATGLSKRSVQNAVSHLVDRRLIQQRRLQLTAAPAYKVLTPWLRKRATA